MKVMGRPVKAFSVELFRKLCAMQCTKEEIAHCLDMSLTTLERRVDKSFKDTFEGAFKRFSAMGKASLRRKQFQLALTGDKTMLVWLGKQYLGQADKQEQSITTDFDGDEKASKHYNKFAGKIFRQLNDKASTKRF